MEQVGQIIQRQKRELTTQRTSLQGLSQQTSLLKSKHGELSSFLTKFNPDLQREICLRQEECHFGDYPTLGEVRKAYGDNAAISWLVPQLYNLSEYCGCRDKLQGKPLEECAAVIASEFYYLKISEVMLFLYRFKSGRYGRFYGSVDPLVITTSLRDFLRERIYAIEQREQEERNRKREEDAKNAITYEQYQQNLRDGKYPNLAKMDKSVK